jgi:hypothetical protein
MAESKRQRRLAGADLARLRAGAPTVTGMSEPQLQDFAGTPEKGLPERAPKQKHRPRMQPPPRGAGRHAKPRGG